ncbi:filamentous hemagglutinin N-terminal domain-containing protein [Brasilonema bromeliae]|uniref:Filamentous hemagglutinin n=1 Tax=Brasilonema bromeliae SPC951 TaxID=385972 RepID=A0ABX1P7G6_9CYAN|nr:filamentous hemagglutinin N-terminal domain-containing protein [Brasilonema bromeliae]NMG19535.1 filamentous hemagglutinin [Brasilonema bromeliae SPC951]
MNTLVGWIKGLGVAVGGAIAFYANCVTAQITPDTTLPNNSRVITQNNIKIIEGGTQAGSNLFHSFEQFSVPTGTTAYFQNATDIQNIISRVTGKSISNIDGILKANGTANLFLINPNRIIFGPNASLNIGGSFIASTASSLNFADGTKFSATDPQTTPLLTVSVPIGLQFGATAAPIRNQSQASPDGATNIARYPVGLQVQPDKTLAIVGGDVILEGGNLTAARGRIELGSVAANSLVSLNPTNQGWSLGYEGVQNFQNIQLIQRTVNGSQIASIIDASGKDGSGNIQLQGKSVELIGNVGLINITNGVKDGGDLTITTDKLIVRDGARLLTITMGEGAGGNLTVNASKSVQVIGTIANTTIPSALSSTTFASGKAGDVNINTGRLLIQDGAEISAESSGNTRQSQFTPATGKGGNLNINASESVELIGTSAKGFPSSLLTRALGTGDAGKVIIVTEKLLVRNEAAVNVSSQLPKLPENVIYLGDTINLGKAGELNISARSILLDNQGKLTSETNSGQGGNINLEVGDLLLLRRNSQISTNAGKAQAIGDGGNIFINAPSGFIVAKPKENSDITANAFTGSGGRVQINATGIFGIAARSREDLTRQLGTNDPIKLDPQNLLTNDITAISQTNPTLNGVVNINTPEVDVKRGLINLPVELKEPRLAQGCDASVARNQSEFIITGRGGIPSNPREVLRSNNVQVDWVSLGEDANNPLGTSSRETQRQRSRKDAQNNKDVKYPPNEIVEAQGWVVDSNGDVILVAQVPTTTPYGSWLNSRSCK